MTYPGRGRRERSERGGAVEGEQRKEAEGEDTTSTNYTYLQGPLCVRLGKPCPSLRSLLFAHDR